MTFIDSVQETEMGRFQAPEGAAAEEDRLRAEREQKEKERIKVLLLTSSHCNPHCVCTVCMGYSLMYSGKDCLQFSKDPFSIPARTSLSCNQSKFSSEV